ncbi:hypothetical protein B0O80DRAFT_431924 [Mortierella sp. GBAus27b]|nr:hypothetical protein B0O80DRAFT_431924 [Mortierella sp. GBAus27b]
MQHEKNETTNVSDPDETETEADFPIPDPDHEPDHHDPEQVFFLPKSRSIDSPDHPAYQLNSLALQDPDPEPSPDEIVAAFRESQGDHAPLLKIEGQVKRQPIALMIDSGANRNFLSRSKAKALGLRLTKRLKPETVNLADSHGLLTTHYAIARVFFGKTTYQVILFDILDMKFEAILGISWLAYSFPRPQVDWGNYLHCSMANEPTLLFQSSRRYNSDD